MFRSAGGFLTIMSLAALAASVAAQPQRLPTPAAGTPTAPAATSPATAPSADASATEYWASIRNSNDPAPFEEFLRRYPDHAFAALATSKLNALRGQGGGQQTVTTQPGQPMAAAPPADGPQSIFSGPSGAQPPVSEEQLASDLQTALKNLNCYTSRVDGDWGRGSRAALQRFNTMAGTTLQRDIPTPEALATVSSWGGGNCKVVAKRKSRTVTKKRTTSTKKTTTARKPPPASRSRGGIGLSIGIGGGGIRF